MDSQKTDRVKVYLSREDMIWILLERQKKRVPEDPHLRKSKKQLEALDYNELWELIIRASFANSWLQRDKSLKAQYPNTDKTKKKK